MITKFGFRLLALALPLSLFIASVQAQTPTPQQIEQFKRLPPAEQQALARSMGINLNDYKSLLDGGSEASSSVEVEPVSTTRTRSANGNANPNAIQEPYFNEDGELVYPEDDDDIEPEDSDELKRFGYDLFNLGADAFTPNADLPVPADYVMGPGDTLVIQLYGKESSTHSLTINRDGTIQFPNIGPVSIAGLSYSGAEKKISEVVSEQMIGIKSSMTMGKLRTIRIFVLGDVNVPGSYVVGSLSTMTNALFASGGISEIGSLRNVQLKRAGITITTLDVYDLLLKGDTSKDARLLPGDVIFVPPVGRSAAADGAVKRPAIYELKSEKNAEQVIALAGGLAANAFLPASKVERIASNGELTFVDINLSESNGRNFKVKDSDIIHVGSSLDIIEGTITIEGHTKRPDEKAWRPGLRFTDIVKNSDALMALPDLEIAIIEREVDNSRQTEVISFSPRAAFNAPMSDADPLLKARDKIILFGYEEDRVEILTPLVEKLSIQASILQRKKVVRVDGSVRFPGEYPLTENMNIIDLVALAGGFTESALGRGAEITRYELSEDRQRIVMHINVDLETENPSLIAGDTLRVKQIPLWQKKETVQLLGEFVHPGTYSILPGETLLDVIERAGGLTAQAFANGAIFSRAELRALEEERLEALREEVEADIAASRLEEGTAKTNIDQKEADEILKNIDGTKPLGRMVINLPIILAEPEELDFQLVEGDVLNVPRFKPSVTIVGEVQYPTSHFFDKKLSVSDYLERSGGLKRNADKKRIYVVRANGMVFQPKGNGWFGGRKGKLNPGDTIIVPLDTNKTDKIGLWSSVTTIMYQAALGITALSRL